jgi:hypothetical protein
MTTGCVVDREAQPAASGREDDRAEDREARVDHDRIDAPGRSGGEDPAPAATPRPAWYRPAIGTLRPLALYPVSVIRTGIGRMNSATR